MGRARPATRIPGTWPLRCTEGWHSEHGKGTKALSVTCEWWVNQSSGVYVFRTTALNCDKGREWKITVFDLPLGEKCKR